MSASAVNPSTLRDRDVTADRLLRSSLSHSYEPSIDLDWDAPLVDGLWGIPEHRVSLYGTPLWDALSPEQRRTLSLHEVCSAARMAVTAEMVVVQLFLRYAYDRDPRSKHIQYALTEIADECRHSVMFAKMQESFGVPDYKPTRLTHELGRLMKAVGYGPMIFAGALYVEESFDQWQRESMTDETLQPLARMVSRIHVTEEARHVRYSREELARIMPTVSAPERAMARYITACLAVLVSRNWVHRDVYASVGIDPAVGHKAALANPVYQASLRWAARKLVPFLRKQHMIGGRAEVIWRKAHLI